MARFCADGCGEAMEASCLFDDSIPSEKVPEPLKDDFMSYFREWTHRQAAAFELLSVKHQTQIDNACTKILAALEGRRGSILTGPAQGPVNTVSFQMQSAEDLCAGESYAGIQPSDEVIDEDEIKQGESNSQKFRLNKGKSLTDLTKSDTFSTDASSFAYLELQSKIRPEVMDKFAETKRRLSQASGPRRFWSPPHSPLRSNKGGGGKGTGFDVTPSVSRKSSGSDDPQVARMQSDASRFAMNDSQSIYQSERTIRAKTPFSMKRQSELESPGFLHGIVEGTKSKNLTGFQSVIPPVRLWQHMNDQEAPSILRSVVRSTSFDLICAFMIIAFMVSLGIETNETVQRGGTISRPLFIVSLGFNAWFTIELILRIAAERRAFLCGHDSLLNIMDVCLVLTSVLDIAIVLIIGDRPVNGFDTDAIARVVRLIRILRAARIVRLARVMRHIYQLRKMVCLIQGCFTTLFWCMVILVAFVYTSAVLFTQGVTDHIFQDELLQNLQDEEMPVYVQHLQDHYGSVERSMNSLFQSMSTGVSWGIVFDPLTKMGWLYPALFMIFVTTSLFGVLNIMTSVFVESTMNSALAYRDLIVTDSERIKQIAVAHLNEVFNDIDIDGDGTLSIEEMTFFLADPSVFTYLEALDINLHDARTLFRLIDTDASGEIDIKEFCDGCLRLKGSSKAFDIHCLIHELSRFFDKWSIFTEFVVHKFDELLEGQVQANGAMSRNYSRKSTEKSPYSSYAEVFAQAASTVQDTSPHFGTSPSLTVRKVGFAL